MAESICGQEDCLKPYEFCEACVRTDERRRVINYLNSIGQPSAGQLVEVYARQVANG